jgi:alginate O-acetyltransferase complex protein AlgI
MVFSSAYFLLLFLPLVFLLYFTVPKKYKNLVILIASIYFYTYGEKVLVLVMLLSTIVDFKAGHLIEQGKRKFGLRLSIITNLATLGIFKYFNFAKENFEILVNSFGFDTASFSAIPNIILPLGISFYVFQTMSYTIDVYRGDVKASRNFIEFATYVTMFPQLVAGPIVRYIDIQKEIAERETTLHNFAKGTERFIIGLAKKMLIANTFAGLADQIFSFSANEISTPYAWIGVFAYAMQIYFDFSGYSDMAIGLGRMFGFNFLENFNYPYISKSITEFWRRWHISLSTWFRDYLYIPLGGNRQGEKRTYINLFIVFFATGLWHGAAWNFIIWGFLHGIFIVLEKLGFNKILVKLWAPLQHIYTLLVVLVGWVLFRAENLDYALSYLKQMFSYSKGNSIISEYVTFFSFNKEMALVTFFALLFSVPFYPYMERKLKNANFIYFRYVSLIGLFVLSLLYVSSGSYNPFIYFKF